MTIAEQLQQLIAIKSDIKTSIEEKGETVGNDAFSTYATHISNIQSGGGDTLNELFLNRLTSLQIASGVTEIPAGLCKGKTALQSLVLPNSVTSIPANLCDGCTNITSITIGNAVTTIGNSAFSGVKYITTLNMPDTVTSIGNGLFNGCSRLRTIKIPPLVTNIQSQTFYSNTSLEYIDIGSGVTAIGSNVFTNCLVCGTVICRATTPPTVQGSSFGSAASNYIGKNVSGAKTLYVPKGCSSAYTTNSKWTYVLLDSTKAGFTVAELDDNGNIPT